MAKKKKSKILPIVALAAGAALMFSSFRKKDADIDADIDANADIDTDADIDADAELQPALKTQISLGMVEAGQSYRLQFRYRIPADTVAAPSASGKYSCYLCAQVVTAGGKIYQYGGQYPQLADGNWQYYDQTFTPSWGGALMLNNQISGGFPLDIDQISLRPVVVDLRSEDEKRKDSDLYYGLKDAPYDTFYDFSDATKDTLRLLEFGSQSSKSMRLRIPEGAIQVGHITNWQPFDAWGDLPKNDEFLQWMRFWSDRGNICPGMFCQSNGYKMTYMPMMGDRHIYRFYFPLEIFNPINADVTIKKIGIVEMTYGGYTMVPYSDNAMLELGGVVQAYTRGNGKAWFNPYKDRDNAYSPDSNKDFNYPDLWSLGVQKKNAVFDPNGATFYDRMPVERQRSGTSGWHTNGESEASQRGAGDQLARLFFGNDPECSYHEAGAIWLSEKARVDLGFNNAKFLTEYKKLASSYTLSDGNPVGINNCMHFVRKDEYHGITIPEGESVFVPISLGDLWQYLHEDWDGLFNGGWGAIAGENVDPARKIDIAKTTEQTLIIKFALYTDMHKDDVSYHTVAITGPDKRIENLNDEISFVHQPWSKDALKNLAPSYASTEFEDRYQTLKNMHDGGYRFIREQCRQHGVPVFGDDLK